MSESESEFKLYEKFKALTEHTNVVVYKGPKYKIFNSKNKREHEFCDVLVLSEHGVLIISDKSKTKNKNMPKYREAIKVILTDLQIKDNEHNKSDIEEMLKSVCDLLRTEWRRTAMSYMKCSKSQLEGAISTWNDVLVNKAWLNVNGVIIDKNYLTKIGINELTPVRYISTLGNIYGMSSLYQLFFRLNRKYSIGYVDNIELIDDLNQSINQQKYGGTPISAKVTDNMFKIPIEHLKNGAMHDVLELNMFSSMLANLDNVNNLYRYLVYREAQLTALPENEELFEIEILSDYFNHIDFDHITLSCDMGDDFKMNEFLITVGESLNSIFQGKQKCKSCSEYKYLMARPESCYQLLKNIEGMSSIMHYGTAFLGKKGNKIPRTYCFCGPCNEILDEYIIDAYGKASDILTGKVKLQEASPAVYSCYINIFITELLHRVVKEDPKSYLGNIDRYNKWFEIFERAIFLKIFKVPHRIYEIGPLPRMYMGTNIRNFLNERVTAGYVVIKNHLFICIMDFANNDIVNTYLNAPSEFIDRIKNEILVEMDAILNRQPKKEYA